MSVVSWSDSLVITRETGGGCCCCLSLENRLGMMLQLPVSTKPSNCSILVGPWMVFMDDLFEKGEESEVRLDEKATDMASLLIYGAVVVCMEQSRSCSPS